MARYLFETYFPKTTGSERYVFTDYFTEYGAVLSITILSVSVEELEYSTSIRELNPIRTVIENPSKIIVNVKGI